MTASTASANSLLTRTPLAPSRSLINAAERTARATVTSCAPCCVSKVSTISDRSCAHTILHSRNARDFRTPIEFSSRLKFDEDDEDEAEAENDLVWRMPSTPFDAETDDDTGITGGRRAPHVVPWTMSPEASGGSCAQRDYGHSVPTHNVTPRSTKSAALTPDPRAFWSDGLRRKTPRSETQSRGPVCPPTPTAPVPFERNSSLWEAKILDSLFSEEAGLERVLHRDFTDVEIIGSGSFFDVFKARSLVDSRIYALKRSRKSFRGNSDRESYLREARLLNVLGASPHVVEYHRAWQEDAHFIVQMEFCQGTLADILAGLPAERPYDIGFVWDCIYQISSGLQHVHANKLVHMDVKSENVLVTRDGICKICDFGQAVVLGSSVDGQEGDCRYIAPELVDRATGFVLGGTVDVFSAGMLFFELITGLELPTSGNEWHRLRDGHTPRHYLHEVTSSLPSSRVLVELVMSMLEPNPSARPTASEVSALSAGQPRQFSYPDVQKGLQRHTKRTRTPVPDFTSPRRSRRR